MAPKGVSTADKMGMDHYRNASINVVYQDPNGAECLSDLQAFCDEQSMLATFSSNNGVSTDHTTMNQHQQHVQV
jgi:hypothetical protein